MYNPFPLLNEKLLKDKILAGKRYFVRQTFRRGCDGRIIAAFLFRAYEAEKKDLAEEHMKKLTKDGNAFLYDASNTLHYEKLRVAARQPFGYNIFYAGKKGLDWKPPIQYQNKMRNYIRRNHPGWQTKPGVDKIAIELCEEFGELLLTFSFDGEDDKILFEEIEKY